MKKIKFINTYILLLILVISLFFILLESKKPYYFLQDDNRTGLLPRQLHSYRGIVEDGEIAFYNFHQYLGIAHFADGIYDFYLPVHFATFLSKATFGHYFATIDIIVFFHLIIGSIGFFYLVSFLDIKKMIAFWAAITWVLNSFVIYVSNSWWIFSCLTAYFPWMLLFSLKLLEKPSNKILFLLVLARLLFFFTTHFQMISYSIIFEALTFILIYLGYHLKLKKKIQRKSIFYYALSYVFLLFLSLPILLPVWHSISSSAYRGDTLSFEEFSAMSMDISDWLLGLVDPFSGDEHHIFYNHQYICHIGYLTLFFIFAGLLAFIKRKIEPKYGLFLIVFFILAIFALLWTTGILNRIIYLIPFLNRMRWHFKLNIFSNFYLTLIASIGLHFFIQKLTVKPIIKKLILTSIIFLQFVNFSILYLYFPQRSLNSRVHQEQPPLYEPLKKQLKEGRILSLGINMENLYSHKYLGFNYATYWKFYHFSGNYTFINDMHNKLNPGCIRYFATYLNLQEFPINFFRYWGIKWYVLANNETDPKSAKYANHYSTIMDSLGIELKFEEDRKIYYDENAKPMIYWAKDQSTEGIKYKINTNSIEVTTQKYLSSDVLVINFLYDPGFTAKIDGEKTNIIGNKKSQLAIKVPQGKHKVEIRYTDPYFRKSIYIVLIFLGLFVLIYSIYPRIYQKNSHGEKVE